MRGEVCVYLGPLENTLKAEDMLAALQRANCLIFKWAQTDITITYVLSTCCV